MHHLSRKDCKVRAKAAKAQELLIRAAKKLFAEKGFDGVSIKELCKFSGHNVSLVSYYFGGKEGLYQACLEKYGEDKLNSTRRTLQPAANEEEFKVRLKMFIEEMFLNYLEEPALSKIIHRDIELDNPLTQDVFREKFLKIFNTLIDFIKSAQKSGILRSNTEAQTLAMFLFGIITHNTRMDHLNKRYFGNSIADVKYREQIVADILKLFFNGIMAGAPAPAKDKK